MAATNSNTVFTWDTVVALLHDLFKAQSKKKEKIIDILKQLRAFRLELKYGVQEDSRKNVEAIRDEVSNYLCITKGIIAFDSFFCSIKYREEIFTKACRLYLQRDKSVTFSDVIFAAIYLIDDLIDLLNRKI